MNQQARAFDVVIVGAGQAGLQVAMSLVDAGYQGGILLAGDEAAYPYQRPPLSKLYLSGGLGEQDMELQDPGYYAAHGITVMTGTAVTAIDRAAKKISLATGEAIGYRFLVLATGARARRLPSLSGTLENVFHVRTRFDARALRDALQPGRRVAVIGGGFLGLEIAAVARTRGATVDVVEGAARILSRSAAGPVSAAFDRLHRRHGVVIHAAGAVQRVETAGGRVVALDLGDGGRIAADAVVVAIGVSPNTGLAVAAGLDVADGIRVDSHMRTADPGILAIGDCAGFPYVRDNGAHVRVESVQNALDQARCAAKTILGQAEPYDRTPVFWTEQFGLRLQVAGIPQGADDVVIRGDVPGDRFSVYRFKAGRLMAVESVNMPADHMLARKLFSRDACPSPRQVADAHFDLKSLLPHAA